MKKVLVICSMLFALTGYADDFNSGISDDFNAGTGDYGASHCVMINGNLVCN